MTIASARDRRVSTGIGQRSEALAAYAFIAIPMLLFLVLNIGSILYALIGVVIFWLSFLVIDKMTPYHLWGEIVEKHNIALGIVVGAMCLGISIIVAAAIH